MRASGWAVVLVAFSGLLPRAAVSQEQPSDTADSRIQEVRELRDERRFREAAEHLRAYLRDHPRDVAMLRLLATTLRGAGETAAAREAFEGALRHQPADPLLRLDYADLLLELRAVLEARRILQPVIDDPGVPDAVRADARVLLGRLARAAGNEAEAEDELRSALELVPDHPGALRQLRELYRERAPWLRTDVGRQEDDQPLVQTAFSIEGERGILPWLDGRARARVRTLAASRGRGTVPDVRLGAVARWELLNLEASGWGGAFRRSVTDENDWQAAGEIGFVGPGGARVRFYGERGPYLLTEASLDTALVPATFGGGVGRPDVGGWAGNLEYRQQRFGDEVKVEDFRAWILAPVLRDRGGVLRLGYEFHGADADDVLFAPTLEKVIPFEGPIPGRYEPIYTPQQLQIHSARADVRIETDGTLAGTLEGAWGFEAEEEAPLLFASVPELPRAGVGLQLERRSFDPWHISARVRYLPVPSVEVVADAGYRSTAFNSYSFFRVSATLFELPRELR